MPDTGALPDPATANRGFLPADPRPVHVTRARAILRAHPEVRRLYGPSPVITPLVTLGLVAGLFACAWLVADAPIWVMLLVALTAGASIAHALFVIFHECAHNLAFGRPWADRLLMIFANLPLLIPSAIGFRNHHLLHHIYQGEYSGDPDVPGEKEAGWVGNVAWRKALWFAAFPWVQGWLRPRRLGKVALFDTWSLVNIAGCLATAALVVWLFGWQAAIFLVLSTYFSIGFHPYGGRWIQEHYVFAPGQETYSYYGPGNLTSLNIGYHNEHHDFPNVAWWRLPRLRRIGSDHYDALYAHRSWLKLLARFIFDPAFSLRSRMVRPDRQAARETVLDSGETETLNAEWQTRRLDPGTAPQRAPGAAP